MVQMGRKAAELAMPNKHQPHQNENAQPSDRLILQLIRAGLNLAIERAWPWLVLASSITASF